MMEVIHLLVGYCLALLGMLGIFILGAGIYMLAGLIALLLEVLFGALVLLLGQLLGWKDGEHYRHYDDY